MSIHLKDEPKQCLNKRTLVMVEKKKYKTFEGVFTPSLLTILGVIMYMRLGWVVGNAGLIGAIIIIIIARHCSDYRVKCIFSGIR